MKKEMILETNDEAVDLSRRSMMGRFGLMASLACAAPVLMTLSTSAQASHKDKDDQGNGSCKAKNDEAASKNCRPEDENTPDPDIYEFL